MGSRTTAVLAMTVLMGITTRVAADPVPTLVVHLADHEHVPASELVAAEARAAHVYERIGVRLEWTEGSAKLAPADGALHVDVFILSSGLTQLTHPPDGVFGQASHMTQRAYIFYPRIFAQARRHGGDPACALAVVLAHEIGHTVLPEYSHSASGLMKADWEGRIREVPDFLPSQAALIRTILSATE